MMNGDVLTTLDYGDLYRAHCEAGNVLTVATHRRVVKTDSACSTSTAPGAGPTGSPATRRSLELPYIVSMGVYVVEPPSLELHPGGRPFDLPDLVLRADRGRASPWAPTSTRGYWLDIGRHEDYERAIADFERIEPLLLPGRLALPERD